MSIRVEGVSKRFGKFVALDKVSLDVPAGALVALLGPSGSGKTTLLRIIAGLEVPDRGSVYYHEEDVTQQAARSRNVGFVFQHYALFRHMTVFENVAFGLRVRHWPAAKVKDRVDELLHLVRLEGLEQRYPAQLSGGQRQRVALARSLAAQPRVLLLDEPFGALDAKVRQELRQWLRRLHYDMGVTSILVTHDQEEAFEVADRVVILHAAKIAQQGTPREVFEQPASAVIMDFLGNVNVFQGRVHDGRIHLGNVALAAPEYANAHEHPTSVYVRPHELDVDRAGSGNGSLEARVQHINPAGSIARVQVLAPDLGGSITVHLSPERLAELDLQVGEVVYLSPRRARVFLPEYSI